MQFLKSKFGGLVIILFLIITILFVRESRLLTAPNANLINDTYDGFRTYAAMVYHIKHDSTYAHYEGMNYPYGDKAAFTDNLPLIANTVKFISENISDISDYSAGILNGFLLLSIVLCAVFLFLCFKTLKLPNWYAIAIALGITMLSPQLLRMSAHYGLAHPFVIPMMIWLSLLFHKNKRWLTSLGIAFALFLCAHIHFYLFAVGGGFVIALMGFKTIFAFNKKATVINGLHLLIQVALPFIILQYLMHDSLPDRPSRPYGFFAYKACWESVFIPVDFQIGRWINEYVYKIPKFDREGMAYIGLIPVLFLLKEVVSKTWNRIFKKEYFSILPAENRFFLKAVFWACLALLIFSFGFPFVIDGLEDWRYKIGPLAQFRSIGRFAWIFFYGFNILAFYALYFQIKKIKKRVWQRLMYFIIIGVLLSEGGIFLFDKVKLNLWEAPEIRANYQKSDNVWIDSINTEDYQAILSIPFFHIGSENIWMSPQSKEMHRSMWLAVQTGLPINSSFMGRSSVGQIINQLELIAEPYRIPQIIEDLPNQKDFLVFIYKKSYKRVKDRYQHLIQNLKVIHEDDQIKVLGLPVEEIRKRIIEQSKRTKLNFQNTELFDVKNFKSTDSLDNFIHLNYDDQISTNIYKGTGAFQQNGYPASILFDGHLPFQDIEDSYVCSVWAYIKGDLYPKVKVSLEEYQAGTGTLIHKKEYQLYKDFRSFDQDWMLSEFLFKMKRPDSRLRVKVWNKDLQNRPIFLDELQIRPADTKLYLENGMGMNNRWY